MRIAITFVSIAYILNNNSVAIIIEEHYLFRSLRNFIINYILEVEFMFDEAII